MSRAIMCFMCKEKFPKEELISYAAPMCTVFHNYCKHCYEERLERDRFNLAVCRIFGIKSPGPLIWTQRKNLMAQGFTDSMIIDCLEYIYKIKKYKILKESLGLVTRRLYDEMIQYKERNKITTPIETFAAKGNKIEYIRPREEQEKETKELDPNDFLND